MADQLNRRNLPLFTISVRIESENPVLETMCCFVSYNYLIVLTFSVCVKESVAFWRLLQFLVVVFLDASFVPYVIMQIW